MNLGVTWLILALGDRHDRRYVLLLLLTGLAVCAQSLYRVPIYRADLLLPALLGVLSGLTILFIVKKVSRGLLTPAVQVKMTAFDDILASVQILLVVCSTLMYLNGDLGQVSTVEQQTRILRIERSRLQLPFQDIVSLSVLHLQGWSGLQGAIRLPVRRYELSHLWGGQVVRVHVHRGYFGVPWVSSIERDDEYYMKEVIKNFPAAAEGWKRLIEYYRAKKRWTDAYTTVQGYLKVYPKDYRSAAMNGHHLLVEGLYDQAIELLRYAMGGRPNYSDYQALGWALQARGRTAEGVKYFEASIPIAPREWEAYFHLGEAYAALGRRKEAIVMYEKVLELRPGFPEMQHALRKLKQQDS
jgi:tetratricopeptide (TPR) repeat protein